ncbi:unnamed protein product [Lactuca virosa]|uniref:DUF223 domain-containing protein n=1 Tax=Lactuca virosa TaxID=75947 RepID=A0AAU9LK05_9ASTR|nr:unnamed protein product [Lactuca virosa]
MEHITPIKEIGSIKDDFTIKVRIIRLWTQNSKFDANDTYSVEMVLIDEEILLDTFLNMGIWDTKLKVTLWGHNAYYMHDFLANNNSLAPVVVSVQFVRVKFINGRPFSSTYFDVSRLFINNDMDEITSYKNKLVSENGQQLSSSGIKMMASKQDTEHDDFLKNNLFSKR